MQINGTGINRFTEFQTTLLCKAYYVCTHVYQNNKNSLGSTNQLLTDILCFNLRNNKSLKIVNFKNFEAGQ